MVGEVYWGLYIYIYIYINLTWTRDHLSDGKLLLLRYGSTFYLGDNMGLWGWGCDPLGLQLEA